ncbi:MoxR family ATPase [Aeoliella sp. ICT_H6.2]|uniref:MoxR family ATPase n=1 Tax=Aeoliella straminimaris TaxID=2954799 RepID=A0A9X2FGG2_9BACT|nr:MoxR family ATPase [Aeoliella straminimaris]MCO6047928.1 MoxR family ATPase [Aeoliella straminimaris]
MHEQDPSAVDRLNAAADRIRQQLSQVIVGQQEVIDQLLITLFCRGHCLLEGVPGLAKTLLISTLAKSLNLTFNRIQFTPDLMPADIIGTDIIEENKSTGQREMRFLGGPIFAHVILADEINRTPPKTQAALLEAMQERQVSVGMVRHQIGDPFFVLATQNPIEQEGTYPLPEAQQDRFMLKVLVRYPSVEDEVEIARRTTSVQDFQVEPVLAPEEVLEIQHMVRLVPVSEHLIRYAVALVRSTRIGEPEADPFAVENLSWGAGPRAVQYLLMGAKGRSLMMGRPHVALEDIQALAAPVLRHRLLVNYTAESEGITSDDVVGRLIENLPAREDQLSGDPRFQKVFAS